MNREILLNRLTTAKGNATDVYFGLYTDFFEKGDEPEEALRMILEYSEEIGDTEDKNPAMIERQEESRLITAFEEIISGAANRIADRNLPKEEFYRKLYATVFSSDSELFPQSREEKVIALKILSESVNVVPYYQVRDTERVSKEEFESGIDRVWPSVQEAFYMLQRQFATTPEATVQLLRIADSISDKKDRIIFWTVIISKLRRDSD